MPEPRPPFPQDQNGTLSADEKGYRALVEHSRDAVALVSADGAILCASPATTCILGYPPDELTGQNALELLHPDDRGRMTERWAGSLQQPGAVTTAQFRCRHRNGSWRWVQGTGINLLAEPRVQAVVATYRDLTPTKDAEEELRRQAATLRAQAEVLRQQTEALREQGRR